ncbi:Basic region leucine zipper [Seminavis robusta]|uniref:Basic region leucine zipper n=1 Tax=Seminavis robusta TaxID=568900 RepID=A0A9N8HJL0_9STRA|nr:Basic region leucine zipper [Seminavis robusta]|eukprot:Sro868_g213360.1 Basic region leucine zipper (342) ;mRNA; f:34162-35327
MSTPTAEGKNEAAAAGKPNDSPGARPLLASTKRPLMTHSKDGKLLSEKKLRRLEKNRLSARECRRRKREATENLEREINVLEAENLRLRIQLQIGEEAEDKRRQEEVKVTEGIHALLESGASEAEIYENIEKFKEKFADYGRDRRSAIEFHLRNIERLLMPTQTTTIAMRALQGGDIPNAPQNNNGNNAFAVSPTSTIESAATTGDSSIIPLEGPSPPKTQDPKALFQFLVNHLEVSPEQGAALKDSRFVAQELDTHLDKALKVVEELKTRLTECGEDLESEFDNIRAILTPTQAAKFLVWVANNGACMHMLNELWHRAYPHSLDTNSALEASPSMDNDSP